MYVCMYMYVMCNTTRMHTGYRPGAALPRPSSALPARGGNCGLSRQHEAGVQLDRVCRQGSSPPPTELVTHPLCPNQSATDCRRVPRSDGYPGEYTTYSTSIYKYGHCTQSATSLLYEYVQYKYGVLYTVRYSDTVAYSLRVGLSYRY